MTTNVTIEVTLPTQYQSFIHRSRYARWLEDKGRRETWNETVDRYINFMCYDKSGSPLIESELVGEIRHAILHLDILPSMRAMMTAGPALEKTNVAGYNCAYTSVDKPIRFAEILYILMCGTGIGFSCEKSEIATLPEVPGEILPSAVHLVVEDSKEGWAEAYKWLVCELFEGYECTYDLSLLRPKGARLKTFGGRSSGPEPLRELFEFTIKTLKQSRGRKLKPIEVHDIVCKIGEVVVVGGVRRSAEISLSDLSDTEMALAKTGTWWVDNPQRALANNSAVYEHKPSMGEFMDEWVSLYKSGSGERGIFSRAAARMLNERVGRKNDVKHGTNPLNLIAA